jgi:hypothetical protein
MESHFEYGARVGYWRICGTVDSFGLLPMLNACARALEATPWIGADAARLRDPMPRLPLGAARSDVMKQKP